MKKRNYLIYLLLITSCFSVIAQDTNVQDEQSSKTRNKGKVYFYWGWNISQYSNSDIQFTGDNYDFTVNNARAQDRQSNISFKNYLQPNRITIPQTNARLGYFFHDNWNVSIGLDHMKYVLEQFQNAEISGEINLNDQNEGTQIYNGTYNNTQQVLNEDFLTFEHTDGLNYINLGIARVDNLGEYFNWDPKKIQINLTEGFEAGVLIPKTNAKVLDKDRYDEFHLAGYGLSLKGGINITFLNNFFVQLEIKGGFIDMQDIRTTASKSDRAKQNFFFAQENITFGYIFKLF